jgi:hypothetical protein
LFHKGYDVREFYSNYDKDESLLGFETTLLIIKIAGACIPPSSIVGNSRILF